MLRLAEQQQQALEATALGRHEVFPAANVLVTYLGGQQQRVGDC